MPVALKKTHVVANNFTSWSLIRD